MLFNAFACFGYLTSATYMAYTVMLWLYPRFLLQPAYMAYPAMTGAYVSIVAFGWRPWRTLRLTDQFPGSRCEQYIGTLAGIVHGADACAAYRAYRAANR